MKSRAAIVICAFACISLSASFPITFQDDFGAMAMYPLEYYPTYFQNDFAKIDLDFARWFRNAANSVKHFYNYVNALIFGRSEEKGQFIGRYPTFKENNNSSDRLHAVSNHPETSGINLPHIQAVEIYKDSNGNMIMRKLINQKGNFQFIQNIPIKPDVKLNKSVNFLVNENAIFRQMNSKIAMNPFHWNEKLEKDELFSGAFKNYAANPELLWHSGIFPFQPMGIFNTQGENVMFQSHSTKSPTSSPHVSNEQKNTEITDQNEPHTTKEPEVSTTFTNEEPQSNESSSQRDETSNSSNDESPSDNEYNSQYEIAMDIERLKNNNSNSFANNNDETDTDATESSDVSVPDEMDETNGDNDDTDNTDLTELDTMQVSSDDDDNDEEEEEEEDHLNQNNSDPEPEVTNTSKHDTTSYVNQSADDDQSSSRGETSTVQEETKKVDIPEKKSESIAKNNFSQNSDESDIAKKVLAIVNPH